MSEIDISVEDIVRQELFLGRWSQQDAIGVAVAPSHSPHPPVVSEGMVRIASLSLMAFIGAQSIARCYAQSEPKRTS